MKKVFLVLVIALGFNSVDAQKVNGLELEDIPAKYVEIVSTGKMMKPFQVTVYLDYGQIGRMKDLAKGRILGEDGKNFSFNGTMGVLNLLNSKGYKYINQYVLSTGGQDVYHTLLENTNYNE